MTNFTNEELVSMYQSGRREVIEQLWNQNKGFIVTVAKKYSKIGKVPFDDLCQQAYFGLLAAAEAYDPQRGYRFSSLFGECIENELERYISNVKTLVRVPENRQYLVHRFTEISDRYEMENGRRPSVRYISIVLGIPESTAKELSEGIGTGIRTVSLSAPVKGYEDDGITLEDTLSDTKADGRSEYDALIEEQDRQQAYKELWEVVDTLPEKQAAAIRDRYLHDTLLKDLDRGELDRAMRELRKRAGKNRILREYMDAYTSMRPMAGVGVGYFNRTFTSSTEREAMRLLQAGAQL